MRVMCVDMTPTQAIALLLCWQGKAEDGLLTALLAALPSAAPSLQVSQPSTFHAEDHELTDFGVGVSSYAFAIGGRAADQSKAVAPCVIDVGLQHCSVVIATGLRRTCHCAEWRNNARTIARHQHCTAAPLPGRLSADGNRHWQPVLQALHLDIAAAYGMVNSSLAGIAGLGGRLRQLAILGLQYVSDGCLIAALEQLPLLQAGDVHCKALPAASISGDGTTP
jgi:hypothetical protein